MPATSFSFSFINIPTLSLPLYENTNGRCVVVASINTIVQTVVPSLCAHRSSLLAAAIDGSLSDTFKVLKIQQSSVLCETQDAHLHLEPLVLLLESLR